jgi:hypothetical protein
MAFLWQKGTGKPRGESVLKDKRAFLRQGAHHQRLVKSLLRRLDTLFSLVKARLRPVKLHQAPVRFHPGQMSFHPEQGGLHQGRVRLHLRKATLQEAWKKLHQTKKRIQSA